MYNAILSLIGTSPTSINSTALSAYRANTEPQEQSLLPLATVAFLLTASWKLFLWRARTLAKFLRERASKLWTDGTPMLDCSNLDFHRQTVQTAIRRGIVAFGTIPKINSDISILSKGNSFYSYEDDSVVYSSGSSSSITSTETDNDEDNLTQNLSIRVKRHAYQVGGISSSKLPVLTLEPHFILKPLRLMSFETFITHTRFPHCKDIMRAKHVVEDRTKIYRGVREIAFYEALYAASSLPSLDTLLTELVSFIKDEAGLSLSLVRLFSLSEMPNDVISTVARHANLILNLMRVPCRRTKLLEKDKLFNALIVLAAYRTGDPQTVEAIQSCARSWYYFARELAALKSLSEFTACYIGLIDTSILEESNFAMGNGHVYDHTASIASDETSSTLNNPYLILKDLTTGFQYPNIIDIKMGTQTYEPDASQSKQRREIQKYPLQSEFGFRIVGMRVYDSAKDEYRYWDKSFGSSLLSRNDCKNAFKSFFQCESTKTDAGPILSHIVNRLTQIKTWFKNTNSTLAFYASSILIVYEGSINRQLHNGPTLEPMLKIIDFAHVCRRVGGDIGFLHGVECVLSILSEVIQEISIV
eukprot:CCRYP_019715-RA/>CCRYP_019715-RA protein AED:0.02 eAED:0.02 QI:102/1/1/1/1/1/2/48/586